MLKKNYDAEADNADAKARKNLSNLVKSVKSVVEIMIPKIMMVRKQKRMVLLMH